MSNEKVDSKDEAVNIVSITLKDLCVHEAVVNFRCDIRKDCLTNY